MLHSKASRREAEHVHNIWQSMGLRVFRDADPADTEAAGNEADAGPSRNQYAINTDA